MGKKQHRDVSVDEPTESNATSEPVSVTESATDSTSDSGNSHESGKTQLAQVLESQTQGDPLMQEVRAFLDQRSLLARKLSEEIAATEKKLAELKRTHAQLFPEHHPSESSSKDRKPKKQRPKPSPKAEPVAPPEG